MKLIENINKKIQTKFTPLWAHDPDKFPHKYTHNMNMNMNYDSEIMGSDLLASVAEKFAIEKELAFYLFGFGAWGGGGGTCRFSVALLVRKECVGT